MPAMMRPRMWPFGDEARRVPLEVIFPIDAAAPEVSQAPEGEVYPLPRVAKEERCSEGQWRIIITDDARCNPWTLTEAPTVEEAPTLMLHRIAEEVASLAVAAVRVAGRMETTSQKLNKEHKLGQMLC